VHIAPVYDSITATCDYGKNNSDHAYVLSFPNPDDLAFCNIIVIHFDKPFTSPSRVPTGSASPLRECNWVKLTLLDV